MTFKNYIFKNLWLQVVISLIVGLAVGLILGGIFLEAYLNDQIIFYGSLLGSVVLFLLGAILTVTAIILFSMANLIRDRY